MNSTLNYFETSDKDKWKEKKGVTNLFNEQTDEMNEERLNTAQYGTTQCIEVQYDTVQCSDCTNTHFHALLSFI